MKPKSVFQIVCLYRNYCYKSCNL